MNYKCNIDYILNQWLQWSEFTLRLLVRNCQITAFQMVFCKFEIELLQVDIGIEYLEMCFKLVRYQIPHYYQCFRSKTNMKKWYFEYFIANSCLSFNKKDPLSLSIYLYLSLSLFMVYSKLLLWLFIHSSNLTISIINLCVQLYICHQIPKKTCNSNYLELSTVILSIDFFHQSTFQSR